MPKEVPDDASHVPVLRVSGDVVASNSLQVIDPCDPLVAGYLASRAYAIWCDGVGSHAGGLRKNSSTEVYNTFPFPEFGGPFDEEIREALDNLNQALSFHLVGTYESFYANADELPEAVKNGHQWLDRAVLASFGINSTATDEEILDALEARYHLLAGNPPHPHDGKAAA